MYELQSGLKMTHFVSTILEVPEVIIGIPRAFALVVVWDGMQQPTVLAVVSRNDPNYMGIGAHDDPRVLGRDAPPCVVSYDAGDEVSSLVNMEP